MLRSILHGLARAFTIPRAVRNQLNALPLASVEKQLLVADIQAAAAGIVAQHVSDPTAQAAINAAVGHAIAMTGIAP